MFAPILFVLAEASVPAAPLEVRAEDSALLPISEGVLCNNVYGKGDITHFRLPGGRRASQQRQLRAGSPGGCPDRSRAGAADWFPRDR